MSTAPHVIVFIVAILICAAALTPGGDLDFRAREVRATQFDETRRRRNR